jgi:hypothetical protein
MNATTPDPLPGAQEPDSHRLVNAAADAVVGLTKREAQDVTAAVLLVLSELIDEHATDDGWPTADDLVALANDCDTPGGIR